MNVELPQPSPQDQESSRQLKEIIADEIRHSKGHISFEHYMHACLYTETLGYYERDHNIFGRSGDFTTSPERSRYFAIAFAAHIKKIHKSLGKFTVVEVGAGSGQFAVDLISALKNINCVPEKYLIIEKSDSLKSRQKKLLTEQCSDAIDVSWRSELDEEIQCGVVIANEVLDALPVRLINISHQQILERCVGLSETDLIYIDVPADEQLIEICASRLPNTILKNNTGSYLTEINTAMPEFIEQMAALVKQGIFFYIDYGYPRKEYYQPSRSMGTLICHYRHVANDQALTWPGLQDISSNVDFTALAEAAQQAELHLNCYCTQAHFLMASNFLEMIEVSNTAETLNEQAELKRLMMPGEMGERFQVMVLTKNMDVSEAEFAMRDLTHRL